MTKISVLTTVYNETFAQVKRAIESVKKQTNQNIEVEHVVIVDNPEYENIDKLRCLENTLNSRSFYLIIIQNKNNLGLSKSLNKAISVSSAEILARLDADDWMNVNRLAKQIHTLELECSDIVYSDTLLFMPESNKTTYSKSLSSDKIALLSHKNFISHSSVMFLKSAVISVGLYREMEPAEDYDLWLRMLNSGKKFGYISKPLTSREIRFESISNSDLNLQMRMADFVRYINKKSLNSIKSKPRKMDNQKKLDKINKKIKKFRGAKGLKKIILGTTSIFILKSSINDVIYKFKLHFFSR